MKGKGIRILAIAGLLMMATMFAMATPVEAGSYNRYVSIPDKTEPFFSQS